jgi:hypothetical protein
MRRIGNRCCGAEALRREEEMSPDRESLPDPGTENQLDPAATEVATSSARMTDALIVDFALGVVRASSAIVVAPTVKILRAALIPPRVRGRRHGMRVRMVRRRHRMGMVRRVMRRVVWRMMRRRRQDRVQLFHIKLRVRIRVEPVFSRKLVRRDQLTLFGSGDRSARSELHGKKCHERKQEGLHD